MAIVGTDFKLTCTISYNSTVSSYVVWLRNATPEYILTNTCKADTYRWPTYIYTCNDNVFTLTIPGDGIDPYNDNGIPWKCSDGGYHNSDPVIITVLSKI